MDLSLDDYILQSNIGGGSGGSRVVGRGNKNGSRVENGRNGLNGLKKSVHKEITFGSPPTSGKVVTTRSSKRELGADVFKSLDEVVVVRGFQKPIDKYKSPSKIRNGLSPSPVLNGGFWGETRCFDEKEEEDKNEQWCFSTTTELEHDESNNNGNHDPDNTSQDKFQWPKGLTPYQAVCYLAHKAMEIELKIGKLLTVMRNEEGAKHKQNLNHLWRCIITCGEVTGKADSCREIVAREMASHDFLKMLRKEYPEVDIPNYEPPQEIFFHPLVCQWVQELGAHVKSELKLETMFTRGFKVNHWGQKGGLQSVYVSTYHIGDRTYQGVSAVKKYSVVDAARKVWEFFTGEKFLFSRYTQGRKCDPLLKYYFSKYEVDPYPYEESPDLNNAAPSGPTDDESDWEDESEDTFPAKPFSKFLEDNPDLNEKMKITKEDEVRNRMRKTYN